MCEADLGPTAADQLHASGLEQELKLCKQFLQESQEDVQQLQAQLERAKQATAVSSNANTRLQRELQAAQEQTTQLQQQLASAHAAKAQLTATDAQLAAAKQQLAEANQALKAMQKAMHDLQTQRQHQEQHWAADAEESAAKLAAVKSQAAAGVSVLCWACLQLHESYAKSAKMQEKHLGRPRALFELLLHVRYGPVVCACSQSRAEACAGSSRAAASSHGC
jgi:chromosome segregation ATPase